MSDYEVVVKGRIVDSTARALADLGWTATAADHDTLLHHGLGHGDSSALFGLVRKIESLALEIVAVHQLHGSGAMVRQQVERSGQQAAGALAGPPPPQPDPYDQASSERRGAQGPAP